MNRILSAIVLAAVSTATTWAVQRWLNANTKRRLPRPQLEDWENEGGALAPHHAALETSQVSRRA